MKALQIIIISFILLTAGFFIYFSAGNNPEVFLLEHLKTLEQHHVYLILLILMLTLLSTLSGLPVFYFGVSLGFLLPVVPAFFITWSIFLVSVMTTFYLVRFAFYRYFRERYGKKNLIRKINRRIKKYGIWTVVFSRAVYFFPTNILNFSYPISKITTRQYMIGIAIGLVPETLINVIIGYLVKHEMILISSPDARVWKILIIAGFIFLFTIIFVFLRIRQKRLSEFRRMKAIVPMEEPRLKGKS